MGVFTTGRNFLAGFIVGALFYWVVYPTAIQVLGVVHGFTVMTVTCCIFCLTAFYYRSKTKQDWFELDKIKTVVTGLEHWKGNGAKQLVAYLIKTVRPFVFVGLSLWTNPVVATVYTSDPGYYGKLRANEWKLFFASLAINNLYHAVLALGIGEAVLLVYSFFS